MWRVIIFVPFDLPEKDVGEVRKFHTWFKEKLNNLLDDSNDKLYYLYETMLITPETRRSIYKRVSNEPRVFRNRVKLDNIVDLDRIYREHIGKPMEELIEKTQNYYFMQRADYIIPQPGVKLILPDNEYTVVDKIYRNTVSSLIRELMLDKMPNYKLAHAVSGYLESDSLRELFDPKFETTLVDLVLMDDELVTPKMVKRFFRWRRSNPDRVDGESTEIRTGELFGQFLIVSETDIKTRIEALLFSSYSTQGQNGAPTGNVFSAKIIKDMENPLESISILTPRLKTAFNASWRRIQLNSS